MRFRSIVPISSLIMGLGSSLLAILPVWAQVSDSQVAALVEALRQAAPQTGQQADGLYSDWQIQPANIPRWSQACIGRELTPAQFAADPTTARQVLVCVMRDVLKDEYRNGGEEAIAVRRSAAWWMTGDANRYDSGDTAAYTQRVLGFYQQQTQATPATSSQSNPSTATQPAQPAQRSVYDRYMEAGYAATQKQDYETALLYFKRALDERPGDGYAQQAIQNVENYQTKTNH